MEIIEAIQRHRSIRKYRPEPVPETLLQEILCAGIMASSSGNMQAYSIIVTQEEALRRKLYAAHGEQRMVLDAPAVLTFCADFHRMRRWLRLRDAPDSFDNFMSFMVAAIDAVLVAQNVALAAESKGLGICFLGSTLAYCQEIGRVLELPHNVVPVAGLALGYPAEDPKQRDRLPYDGLVHMETYQATSDDQIAEVYREREVKGWRRYMSYPRLRARIEESGVENLAQVYTVLKYPRESQQALSRKILAYLGEQEFMGQG